MTDEHTTTNPYEYSAISCGFGHPRIWDEGYAAGIREGRAQGLREAADIARGHVKPVSIQIGGVAALAVQNVADHLTKLAEQNGAPHA